MMIQLKKEAKQILLWFFYFLHLFYFYIMIIWRHGYQIREKCLGNWRCVQYLQVTSFGYWVDTADHQWREFRNHLPLLLVVALITSLIDRFCYYYQQDVSLIRAIIGIIVILVQHQYYAIITFMIATIGYLIPKYIHSPFLGKVLTWSWGIFILFFKESYRLQYSLKWSWLKYFFLNRWSGMYSWRLPANFLVLRMISFNLDYYHTLEKQQQQQQQQQTAAPTVGETSTEITEASAVYKTTNKESNDLLNLDEKSPTIKNSNRKEKENELQINYRLINYISYICYAPLYMAGPIITYKNYLLYQSQPQKTENILFYAFRFLYCYGLMEYLLSTFPCFAIISSNLFIHLSLLEIFILFYLILKIMWLKFLLLWRFFRLWAIVDGTNPPENMMRCMSNNYSLGQFWKYWHSSFNQWIVQYLYLPLGGKYTIYWNVWIIFLFVALWHDLEWKLFYWGMMNAMFYLLEVLVVQYVRPKIFSQKKGNDGHLGSRFVDAFFGAIYILVLILINLIGYSMGTGAIHLVLNKIFTWEGGKVIVGSIYFLFIGVNIMFSIESWRKSTKEKGNTGKIE